MGGPVLLDLEWAGGESAPCVRRAASMAERPSLSAPADTPDFDIVNASRGGLAGVVSWAGQRIPTVCH